MNLVIRHLGRKDMVFSRESPKVGKVRTSGRKRGLFFLGSGRKMQPESGMIFILESSPNNYLAL